MELHENFVYGILNNVVIIIDTNLSGNKSVTNDIENVLQKIINAYNFKFKKLEKILYQDTEGFWSEVTIEAIRKIGEETQFRTQFSISTRSLGEALKLYSGL